MARGPQMALYGYALEGSVRREHGARALARSPMPLWSCVFARRPWRRRRRRPRSRGGGGDGRGCSHRRGAERRAADATDVARGGGGGAEPQVAGAGSGFARHWGAGHGVLRDHQPLPVYLPTDALVWLLFALKHLLESGRRLAYGKRTARPR